MDVPNAIPAVLEVHSSGWGEPNAAKPSRQPESLSARIHQAILAAPKPKEILPSI